MDDARTSFSQQTYDKYNIPLYGDESKRFFKQKEDFIQSLINPDNPDKKVAITIISTFFLILFIFGYACVLVVGLIFISAMVKIVRVLYKGIWKRIYFVKKLICVIIVYILLFAAIRWFKV